MPKKSMNFKPLPILLGVLFTAAGLSYLFWGLDIIPDGFMSIIGYLDDAGVMLAFWILFRRARKKIK